MAEAASKRMTSDEFIDWAMEQPEGECYELVGAEVVAMTPVRAAHVGTKARIWRHLADAIEASGLPCEVYPDGMAVEIDLHTIYEPDTLVRCGAPLADDAIKLSDPIIVVDVLSSSTRVRDAGAKLADYFRLPSVRHYLIVHTEDRAITHHGRGDDDTIVTSIVREGSIRLDPPGITLTELFVA
jgi:Uma2 family endonuclease